MCHIAGRRVKEMESYLKADEIGACPGGVRICPPPYVPIQIQAEFEAGCATSPNFDNCGSLRSLILNWTWYRGGNGPLGGFSVERMLGSACRLLAVNLEPLPRCNRTFLLKITHLLVY